MLGHGQAVEDPPVMRHMHDAAAHPRGRGYAREVAAVHPDRAGHRLEQARDRAERGGLAGAVGAQQGNHLAGGHGERQVAHHRRAVVGGAQAFEFERGGAAHLIIRPTHLPILLQWRGIGHNRCRRAGMQAPRLPGWSASCSQYRQRRTT